jgi:hypothetical protein
MREDAGVVVKELEMLIEHNDAILHTAHRVSGGRERACPNPQKRGLACAVPTSHSDSLWAAKFERPWSELSLSDVHGDPLQRQHMRGRGQAAWRQGDGQRR